jgi:hypothetical protein
MNSKFTNSLVVLAVGGLMIVGSAAAQSSNNTSGAGPGTLTSKQATHLEKRETAVQNREQADMAKHNGHLTKAEQAGINRQQNRISRSIRRDKAANAAKN